MVTIIGFTDSVIIIILSLTLPITLWIKFYFWLNFYRSLEKILIIWYNEMYLFNVHNIYLLISQY